MNCQECGTTIRENDDCYCNICFNNLEDKIHTLESVIDDRDNEYYELDDRFCALEDDYHSAKRHIEHLVNIIKKTNLKLKTMDQHLQQHGIYNQLTLLEEDEPW